MNSMKIDPDSNYLFYQGMTVLSELASGNIKDIALDLTSTPNIAAVTFPKNMHVQVRTLVTGSVAFSMENAVAVLNNASLRDGRMFSGTFPPTSANTNQLSAWGNTIEFDVKAGQTFYLVDRWTQNMETSQNVYLGYYPIEPHVDTVYDDLRTITLDLQGFHPGAEIDDDGHCLSDILDFVQYKGCTAVGNAYPSYDVDITPENVDSAMFSGLSIALDTDLSDVKVSFYTSSGGFATCKNVYGSTTSWSSQPTARTEDYYNGNAKAIPGAYTSDKEVYVFYRQGTYILS